MRNGIIKVRKNSGFTIVELLIVIVVIGILAAIVIVAYNGIQGRARDSIRTGDVANVGKALELYKIDNGTYPIVGTDGTGYDLSTLNSALVPRYIAKLPSDPNMSQNYAYVANGGGATYAILIRYETKTQCHKGVGNTGIGYWGLNACT